MKNLTQLVLSSAILSTIGFAEEKSLPLKNIDKVQSVVCLATKSTPDEGKESGTVNHAPQHIYTFIKKDTIGRGGKRLGNFLLQELEINPQSPEAPLSTSTGQIYNFKLEKVGNDQELRFAFLADWKASGWVKLEEKTVEGQDNKKYVIDIIAKGEIQQKETKNNLTCVLSFN